LGFFLVAAELRNIYRKQHFLDDEGAEHRNIIRLRGSAPLFYFVFSCYKYCAALQLLEATKKLKRIAGGGMRQANMKFCASRTTVSRPKK